MRGSKAKILPALPTPLVQDQLAPHLAAAMLLVVLDTKRPCLWPGYL